MEKNSIETAISFAFFCRKRKMNTLIKRYIILLMNIAYESLLIFIDLW